MTEPSPVSLRQRFLKRELGFVAGVIGGVLVVFAFQIVEGSGDARHARHSGYSTVSNDRSGEAYGNAAGWRR
ncbi:MAG: hypothetical protein KIS68_13490 [Bauldia sp.]|nr:hypothetical protein [Bauldia sp.]